jgi:hypothetical protein
MTLDTTEVAAYRLLQRTIAFCAAMVIAAMLAVFLFASSTSDSRCNDLQDLRAYVLGSTNRAIKSLPTISYYREHPDERANALANLTQQRDEFSTPLDCSIF